MWGSHARSKVVHERHVVGLDSVSHTEVGEGASWKGARRVLEVALVCALLTVEEEGVNFQVARRVLLGHLGSAR